MSKMKNIFKFFLLVLLICIPNANCSKPEEKPSWAKKDIRDYTDADMERLLDQWEEGDDPLEPDELPEHLRPSPKIDLAKLDMTNADNVIRATKKGKGLMMFVGLKKEYSREETESITQRWQTGLHNNHIIAERYIIDDNRAIFMFRDGAQVIDAKGFLLEQPELTEITFEGQTFNGKYNKENMAEETAGESKVKTKKKISKPTTETKRETANNKDEL
ncbi:LDLR chaperone boca [Neodiprion virginianus]|uniref:LDLR chaperone boca n=1 Tax=Neodiprion fabricii TaxID=2872261 RepID=UPI001ED9206B|nr:LDLR chaperone boca [Neodiprion fabricii]XP_046612056.1 LDLR chaperone boca [Neodiprion virginianus]